jgi:hypothetical protein
METTLKRCNNYTPVRFENIARTGRVLTCDLDRDAPQDDLWLLPIGVAVQYSKNNVRILSAGEIALVTVEMCRDNPAMRAALLKALSEL